METKAILKIESSEIIDLYLPEDIWRELLKIFKTNRLSVVLRMMNEYQGNLNPEIIKCPTCKNEIAVENVETANVECDECGTTVTKENAIREK